MLCEVCSVEFAKPKKWSAEQWAKARYCSSRCQHEALKATFLGRGLDLAAMRSAHVQSFSDAGVAYGECQCGCGEPTRVAKQTSSREGTINGEPVRFRKGHAARTLTRADRNHQRNRVMVTGGVYDERGVITPARQHRNCR